VKSLNNIEEKRKDTREKIRDLIPKIKANELPEPYSTIAFLVGLEETLMLAKELGGTRHYFPKFESLFRDNRNEMIYNEFSGGNYKELAKKYNLSETRIREIINEEHNRRYMQINIFDKI
jgi:DNA invertase Pin-like site-specific DNA recombinase